MATSDTALQAALRADSRVKKIVADNRQGRIQADALRALGFDVPDGYSYTFGGRSGYGSLMDNKRSFLETPKGALITIGALATAGIALPALAGAGGATAAAGGTGAATTGAATAAGTGATVAATAAPSLASTLLKYGLQYGLPVAGGLISSKVAANANTDAARLENQYNNRALDAGIEEQTYQRRQGEDERAYQRRIDAYEASKYGEATGYDRAKYAESTNYGRRNYGNFVETLEPYRSAGANANQFASRLLGMPAPNDSGANYLDLARDARTPVNLPTGAPVLNFPSTGNSGAQAGTNQAELVLMKAPDGTVKPVPSDQVSHFVSLGAQVVGN